MKILLTVTAIIEAIAGIAFLVTPVVAASLLLNTQIETAGGLFAARLAGAAIVSLALVCWNARGFESEQAVIGVVTAMLVYNVAAAAVLIYGGIRLGLQSPMIWPAIVLHSVLGTWCALRIWISSRKN